MPTSVRPRPHRGLALVAAVLAVLLVAGRALADDGTPLDDARDHLIAVLTSRELRDIDDDIFRAMRELSAAKQVPNTDPDRAQRVKDAGRRLKSVKLQRENLLAPFWRELDRALREVPISLSERHSIIRKLQDIVHDLGELRDAEGRIDPKRLDKLGAMIDQFTHADLADPDLKELLATLAAYRKELQSEFFTRSSEADHAWAKLVEQVDRAIELAKDAEDEDARATGQRLAEHALDYHMRDRNRSNRAALFERLKLDAMDALMLIRRLEDPISQDEWDRGLADLGDAAERAQAEGDEEAADLANRYFHLSGADRGVVTQNLETRKGFRKLVATAREVLARPPKAAAEAGDPPAAGPQGPADIRDGVPELLDLDLIGHEPESRATEAQLRWIDALFGLLDPLLDDDGPDGVQARRIHGELSDLLAEPDLGEDGAQARLEDLAADAVDLVEGNPGLTPELNAYHQDIGALSDDEFEDDGSVAYVVPPDVAPELFGPTFDEQAHRPEHADALPGYETAMAKLRGHDDSPAGGGGGGEGSEPGAHKQSAPEAPEAPEAPPVKPDAPDAPAASESAPEVPPDVRAFLAAAAGVESGKDQQAEPDGRAGGLAPQVTGAASEVGTPAVTPSEHKDAQEPGEGKQAGQEQASSVPVLNPDGVLLPVGDGGAGGGGQGGQGQPIPDAICAQEGWLDGCKDRPQLDTDVIDANHDLIPPGFDLDLPRDDALPSEEADIKEPELPTLELDDVGSGIEVRPPVGEPDVKGLDLNDGKVFWSSPGSQGPIDLAPLSLSGGIGLGQGWPWP